MENSWTGGQYSLFRVLFGVYLFVHFGYLAAWAPELFSSAGMLPNASLSPLISAFPNILAIIDTPGFTIGLSLTAAIAALFFAIGRFDRLAAIYMWLILASFLGRNPLITNPAIPYVGWMLLAHLLLPRAPYGSWIARGRTDPDAGWRFPPALFLAAWAILGLSYSYSGYTKLLSPSWVSGENVAYVLTNPLARDWWLRDLFLAAPPVLLKGLTWFILAVELLFAPLSLSRRFRPWLWGAMLFVQAGFALLLNFPDLTLAMLLFHLFTFDPAWVKPRDMTGTTVFYDGGCALCHGSVRFLLAEERAGKLTFSPLGSASFMARVSKAEREHIGDTFVVLTGSNELLTESDGVIHVLKGCGGLWSLIAAGLDLLPKIARDFGYRQIGKRRYALFGGKNELCPIVPERFRSRILA